MYVHKITPWEHQKIALEKMKNRAFYALLLQMRCGKTKIIIDDFGELYTEDEVDDLLVIAPAGVYLTWIDAIKEHLGEPVASNYKLLAWFSSKMNGAGRTEELNRFLSPNTTFCRIFLMNIEALSKVKGAQQAVLDFCKGRRVYCVIDESTCIKTPNSKRTKFILDEIRVLCKYRRILTGLVAPKDPLDVYSQFEFLEPGCLGYTSFASFSARYAIIKKRTTQHKTKGFHYNFVKPVAFRDKEELAFRMLWHSYRVKLSDCYDLPPKIYEIRNVELTDKQEKVYSDLVKYATAELEELKFVSAPQVMVRILKLHQVLMGHVKTEEGEEYEIETNRIKALLEVLEEWDDGESKAIIWCSYDKDVQNIVGALRETGYKVARFWGGNRNTREQEEREFKEDKETRIMVATAAAGGRGRTWTVADLVVYYSNSHNFEHRDQSEERPQGIGKTNSVLYVDLVAIRQSGAKTVDMKILQNLRDKLDMSSLLMGDGWREWII